MNDFLDKTLSKNEEREVKNHLEKCETCRSKFQVLENADNTLRQVICEMLADIDVPLGLSDRIEKIMSAGIREKTLWSRIRMLLKTPAAAAALLFVVLAAGLLTYNNYFNLASNQKVALSEKDTGNYTDSAGVPAADMTSPAVDEKTSSKEVRVLQADSDLVRNSDEQLKGAPVENQVKDQLEGTAGILSDQPPMPAVNQAPEALNKSKPVEDQRSAYITSTPLGMGEGMPASNRGTMEEAVWNVGFIPAKPSYLPQGAVLSDVSWFAGEASQNYRAGRFYFTVSQNLLEAADSGYVETFSQGPAVNINGSQGFIQESRPEPGDTVSGTLTTVRWRQGNWNFSVSGDLPAEEIIKISTSIK
jgi:hypothetical protein